MWIAAQIIWFWDWWWMFEFILKSLSEKSSNYIVTEPYEEYKYVICHLESETHILPKYEYTLTFKNLGSVCFLFWKEINTFIQQGQVKLIKK